MRPVAATEITEPDGSVRFVLKDGTAIYRIPPPPELYDYDTGKPLGRLGPRRHSGPSTEEGEVLILD